MKKANSPQSSPLRKDGSFDTSENDDYHIASEQVEQILGNTQPKNFGEGVTSGVGYMLRGAIGAVGAVVLMPTVASAEGRKEAGMVGGIAAGAGGMVAGVVQGANVLGGGLVTGVSQIARGVAATPTAMIAPSKGFWWNGVQGKWVQTNLLEEEQWIKTQPVYDEDMFGEMALPEDERPAKDENAKKVKDTYYYDKLGLDCDADEEMIKRRYFIISRKYSPDRCGSNPNAQEEFRAIGRAYTILMNPGLRAKYDRVGRDRLFEEEDSDDEEEDVDPMMLFTLLFGSEKFNDHIGRLAAVTSTRVGCEVSSKLTLNQCEILQRRRVTRLGLKLAERLSTWAEDGEKINAIMEWEEEATDLCNASYGDKLINVIGKVYTFTAVHFLGSLESGIGMPSMSRWARKETESLKFRTNNVVEQAQLIGGNAEKREMHLQVSTAVEKSAGDGELEELAMDALKRSMLRKTALDLLWQQTVVDITSTVKEAAQMVLNDQSVTPAVRKERAEALEACGSVFEKAKRKVDTHNFDEEGLENVAFHAMLNTVW
eukprot:CAMPEP_0116122510 /NCGR_PEP_ID=MMETSP0329-20121206/4253_1 /TAXON_ID=697910 /ORGANISM="Pseudo-nitzschia arenysensis, Strain B593" /LENGTH=541 /DNA_ID=CAMNT_0003616363 /DNA_START=113 /DNA_END=1735 /DNA_ORIENTATION=-